MPMTMGLKEAIAILLFLFFLNGCYDYLRNHEINKCQMTFMFDYPEYIKIPLKHDVQKRFPRYSLFVYGEGNYAASLYSGKLSGIPILFIPGNAGSYKQARSIGSVLLRMAENYDPEFQFNVFSVDFDEELSGLYGGVLEQQTEFVTICVKQIISLYQKNGVPRNKIILYGHSMGGVIARAVFTHPDFDHNSVRFIINLATPNLAPVISIDKYLHDFYSKVNYHWKHNISADGGGVDHVTFISIAGGDRDILVGSHLTMMDEFITDENPNFNPLSVIATSVPSSWASTDHLCIIWCKQLVLVTARILIDIETKKLTAEKKRDVINYHLIKKNSNLKHYPDNMMTLKKTFEYLPNGFWRERNDKTWIFFRKMVIKHSHILVPLLKNEEMIVITGFNIPKDDWVFACEAIVAVDGRTKICTEPDNLSSKTEMLIPYDGMTRRTIHLSVADLKAADYTHVMVYSGLTNNKVEVIGERYPIHRRHINYQIPGLLEFIFAPQAILFTTASKATFYNVSLVGLSSLWQVYVVKVESKVCQKPCRIAGQGLAQLFVPWSKDLRQVALNCNESTDFLVKLLVPKREIDRNDAWPQLLIYLDPDCTFKITFQVSFNEIMSQIARFYGTLLPAYFVANVLLGFSDQLFKLGSPGPCPDLLSSLLSCSPLNLLAIPTLFGVLYHYSEGGLHPYKFMSIETDDLMLNHLGLYFVFLRPLVYMISYGAVFMSTWLLYMLVLFWSNVFGWIKSRIRKKYDVSVPTEKQLCHISMFPIIMSCLVIAITYVTCGAFVLTFTLFMQFGMVCNMCCDNRLLADRKGEHRFSTRWRLYFTLFLLWLWMALTSAPSLIHWFKNVKFQLKLYPDPALATTVVSGFSLFTLFQYGVPTDHTPSYFIPSLVAYIASIMVTIYGLVNIYRIPYFIATVIFVFSLQQIAAIILRKKVLCKMKKE